MKFYRCEDRAGRLEATTVSGRETAESDGRFLFVGSLLCLDFVNTEMMEGGQRVDRLTDFDALADWLEAGGVLSKNEARAVRERWGGTREGARVLVKARLLRASLRRMVESMADGRRVG